MSRERINFTDAPVPPEKLAQQATSYVHVDASGRKFIWYFRSVGRKDLASALVTYFSSIASEAFAGLSAPTVSQYDSAWRKLARIVNERGAEQSEGFNSISRSDIDALDVVGCYGLTRCVVHTLRLVRDANPSALSPDLKARIKFISRHRNIPISPREPFPAEQSERLKAVADKAVKAASVRIAKGKLERDRLERIATPDRMQRLILSVMAGERMPAGECVPGAHSRDFAESVVIGMYDAVAFIVAIGLRVEAPIECLKTLKRDCLKNEARGFVDIEYVKGRGGSSPVIKRERVRDGGLSTPGGLIRLALELSEPAAARLKSDGDPDAEYLWVGWVERCLPSWRRFSLCNKAFERGVASFARDVIEVDGQVKFSPARMRKTVKAERYRRTGGSLRRFATDHTVRVAARHYAAVDALAEEHRETIRRAQSELVALAQGPLILSSEEEDRIRSGRDAFENARAIGPEELLDGQSDTWLGICRDFWSSPIASDDAGACSASQNICLHCPNAVFTARRLPALLSYRDWLIERRAVVSQVEWLSVYAEDLARIDQQIVPKFRQEEIVLAGSQKVESQGSWAISAHERRV